MTSQELRQKYLAFFASKGHTIIPSAPLVPANDPTVLFTTAGMHPLVPYLLGEKHPGGVRLTSVQKCIRTGDIDEVGDTTHLTFFEMLGNWSLGDYFKQEAIAWSFEFLTSADWLALPPERLAFSCFVGDENAPRDTESAELWKSLGVPEQRIAFLGKEDNWWGPAGQTGPCGPDTEMFYWTGNEPAPESFDPKDRRWVEIWNDVFMQFNKTAEGAYEPLPKPNVDTGMGLERTLVALNGYLSVYETDVLAALLKAVRAHAPAEINETKLKVIVDHMRAASFMSADGVVPANKDRGYVMRKILRRSFVFAKQLELTDGWMEDFLVVLRQNYGQVYPELNALQVAEGIRSEREKFSLTIDKGLKRIKSLLGDYQGDAKEFSLSGSELFDLYQSEGFPIEVSLEEINRLRILNGGQEIPPDIQEKFRQEFQIELLKHQELSRTASAGVFKGGLADHTDEVVRLHTATHLMNAALRQVLGEHVWQKGSNITKERTRFDFTHPQKMSDDEKRQVEELVNQWIRADYQVKREVLPLDEARKLNAIGVFGEKYADVVSVYSVFDPATGAAISREFCGGPHVTHTGEVGLFRIVKEEAVSAGVRRIKAVVGGSAG